MINDLKVNPFTIPHDAAQPVGYRLEHEGHSVGIATDLGKYNDYIIENLQGLDALLLEANHDIRMLQAVSYTHLYDLGISDRNSGLYCGQYHCSTFPVKKEIFLIRQVFIFPNSTY